MNFGIKQRSKAEDFQAEVLAELKSGLKKHSFHIEGVYCATDATANSAVSFEKKHAGVVEVDFVARITGKRGIVTLYMDDLPFLKRAFNFDADSPTYFAYSKSIFVTAGKHELKFAVQAVDNSLQLHQGCFNVTGDGIKAVFLPQASFATGDNGESLYLLRFFDGYYLCNGEVSKTAGRKIVFAEDDLPQKAKVRYFGGNVYILYKSAQGVWKLSTLNQTDYTLPVGVELAVGSECEFCFRTATEGTVYYILNGELFNFEIYNLFATQSVTQRKKVTFDGISQKIKGVFVAPYDGAGEEYAHYLIVWGVFSVVMAIVSGSGESRYVTVVRSFSEPNAVTAFAVDNIFGVGALKEGLLTEYKTVLSDTGASLSATKRRYCNSDAVATKTLSGFIIYDDGEYALG